MVFIGKAQAKRILTSIGTGTCSGKCRQVWLAAIKRALAAKTNPLGLTEREKMQFRKKIDGLKHNKLDVTKYKKRPSPAYPANKYCGKRKRGNDGNMYLSKPNKNGICRWVKVK